MVTCWASCLTRSRTMAAMRKEVDVLETELCNNSEQTESLLEIYISSQSTWHNRASSGRRQHGQKLLSQEPLRCHLPLHYGKSIRKIRVQIAVFLLAKVVVAFLFSAWKSMVGI